MRHVTEDALGAPVGVDGSEAHKAPVTADCIGEALAARSVCMVLPGQDMVGPGRLESSMWGGNIPPANSIGCSAP